MSTAVAYVNLYGLPWTPTRDRERFRRLLVLCVFLVATLGALMPWLPVPQIDHAFVPKPAQTLMQIVTQEPIPVVIPPEEKRVVLPVEQTQVQPKPQKVKEPTKKPDVAPKPETQEAMVSHAREKAAISGVLQFKDSFADMRDAVDVTKLHDTGAVRRGPGTAATLDRSVLTSKYGTHSAGVNLSAYSRDIGGVALAGRETTKVDVPEGTVGNGGVRAGGHYGDPNGNGKGDGLLRGRSIEDIRRVFDANKGAIFSIYNRALRVDPSLQGQVVLELIIDPTGHVVDCRVVSSEIGDGDMVTKVVNRIRLFDFGKEDVGTTTISYPVHFLPT